MHHTSSPQDAEPCWWEERGSCPPRDAASSALGTGDRTAEPAVFCWVAKLPPADWPVVPLPGPPPGSQADTGGSDEAVWPPRCAPTVTAPVRAGRVGDTASWVFLQPLSLTSALFLCKTS